jgi:hypothetical protein
VQWTMKLRCAWLRQALVLGCLALCACNSHGAGAVTPIIVEWTTASEINTAGYNLYRSDRGDGDYIKITSTPVPASPDPLRGGKYRYEDANVEPGKTYYYKLEDIERDGATMQHGPIQATAAASFSNAVIVLIGAIAVGLLIVGGVAVYLRRKTEIRLSWNKHDDANKE